MFNPRSGRNLRIRRGHQRKMMFKDGPLHDQIAFLDSDLGGTHKITMNNQTGYYEHAGYGIYQWVKY